MSGIQRSLSPVDWLFPVNKRIELSVDLVVQIFRYIQENSDAINVMSVSRNWKVMYLRAQEFNVKTQLQDRLRRACTHPHFSFPIFNRLFPLIHDKLDYKQSWLVSSRPQLFEISKEIERAIDCFPRTGDFYRCLQPTHIHYNLAQVKATLRESAGSMSDDELFKDLVLSALEFSLVESFKCFKQIPMECFFDTSQKAFRGGYQFTLFSLFKAYLSKNNFKLTSALFETLLHQIYALAKKVDHPPRMIWDTLIYNSFHPITQMLTVYIDLFYFKKMSGCKNEIDSLLVDLSYAMQIQLREANSSKVEGDFFLNWMDELLKRYETFHSTLSYSESAHSYSEDQWKQKRAMVAAYAALFEFFQKTTIRYSKDPAKNRCLVIQIVALLYNRKEFLARQLWTQIESRRIFCQTSQQVFPNSQILFKGFDQISWFKFLKAIFKSEEMRTAFWVFELFMKKDNADLNNTLWFFIRDLFASQNELQSYLLWLQSIPKERDRYPLLSRAMRAQEWLMAYEVLITAPSLAVFPFRDCVKIACGLASLKDRDHARSLIGLFRRCPSVTFEELIPLWNCCFSEQLDDELFLIASRFSVDINRLQMLCHLFWYKQDHAHLIATLKLFPSEELQNMVLHLFAQLRTSDIPLAFDLIGMAPLFFENYQTLANFCIESDDPNLLSSFLSSFFGSSQVNSENKRSVADAMILRCAQQWQEVLAEPCSPTFQEKRKKLSQQVLQITVQANAFISENLLLRFGVCFLNEGYFDELATLMPYIPPSSSKEELESKHGDYYVKLWLT